MRMPPVPQRILITGGAGFIGIPLATKGWTATLMRLNPLTPLILNALAWFTGQPAQRCCTSLSMC